MNILYATNCPKCKIIKGRLEYLNIKYKLVDNVDDIKKFNNDNNLKGVPILLIDDHILDFNEAMKYLNIKESRK